MDSYKHIFEFNSNKYKFDLNKTISTKGYTVLDKIGNGSFNTAYSVKKHSDNKEYVLLVGIVYAEDGNIMSNLTDIKKLQESSDLFSDITIKIYDPIICTFEIGSKSVIIELDVIEKLDILFRNLYIESTVDERKILLQNVEEDLTIMLNILDDLGYR